MRRASRTPTEREKVLSHITSDEARLLVASYYASQDMRKRLDLQLRHAVGDGGPVMHTVAFAGDRFAEIEKDMAKALEEYANRTAVGRWCQSHLGVGPVITAGLLAHINIERAPTAGHIWAFAGLDPTRKWSKGQRRPYCAAMKQLAYHLGECFKRVSGKPNAFYGHIYRDRKRLLIERNEAGYNAERAKTFVTTSAEARRLLAQGKLPLGNLDRQACNYAAKMFLSHLHTVMYWDRYRRLPPRPFVIEHLGHIHYVAPPNVDEHFPDLADMLRQTTVAA